MKKIVILILGLALIISLAACGSGDDGGAASTPDANATVTKDITLVATNFQFDQAEYKANVGDTINFVLENKEGMHAVGIDKLKVELTDKKPSQKVTLNKAGTYEIHCSLFCGTGHDNMKSTLIVE